jgi:pimeloyl-ACP methyl ester carboxylesterase
LILLLFIIGKTPIENQTKPKSLKGNFLSINGERIRYFQNGNGKDILMIHGTPGSLEDCDSLVDSLAKDYRVTVFDRLGHGYSSSKHYNYHLRENVDLVNIIIDSLHLKNPLLVGHSYGGSTLVHYAVHHANEKKLQMIIIDPPLL